MDDTLRNMMKREARQAAIGHMIILCGLYAAVGFLMPRFLVLFEYDLATRGSIANFAATLAISSGHFYLLIVPIVFFFGYIDYRICLLLRLRRMDRLAVLWSTAVVGSVVAGFLWFCWALSVWHILVWERLNPEEAVPQWALSGTWKAFVLFIAVFVGLVALDFLVGHRERNPSNGVIDCQKRDKD